MLAIAQTGNMIESIQSNVPALMEGLGGSLGIMVASIMICLAAIDCFAGYYVYRIKLGMSGYAVGAAAGAVILAGLKSDPSGTEIFLVSLTCGVIMAAGAVLFYRLSFSITTAAQIALLAGAVGLGLAIWRSQPPKTALILGIVLGGVAGLVALPLCWWLFRRLIVLFTGLLGGAVIAAALIQLAVVAATEDPLQAYERLNATSGLAVAGGFVVLWVGLAYAGIRVQRLLIGRLSTPSKSNSAGSTPTKSAHRAATAAG